MMQNNNFGSMQSNQQSLPGGNHQYSNQPNNNPLNSINELSFKNKLTKDNSKMHNMINNSDQSKFSQSVQGSPGQGQQMLGHNQYANQKNLQHAAASSLNAHQLPRKISNHQSKQEGLQP